MIKCRTGEIYTGCTVDLPRRLREHNSGAGSRFTRTRGPVMLIYTERCVGRSAALKREVEIKKMSRSQKVALAQTASATIE